MSSERYEESIEEIVSADKAITAMIDSIGTAKLVKNFREGTANIPKGATISEDL